MYPWDGWPAGDPRADPNNYNAVNQYVGPPIEGWSQDYYIGIGGSGYDTSGPPPTPMYVPTSTPAGSTQYAYDYSGAAPSPTPSPGYLSTGPEGPDSGGQSATGYVEPAGPTPWPAGAGRQATTPWGPGNGSPGLGGFGTQSPAPGYATTPAGDNFSYTAPPPPPSTGYAATPAGDNFTLSGEDERRFREYEAYLAGGGASPAAAPLTVNVPAGPIASGPGYYDSGFSSGGYDAGFGALPDAPWMAGGMAFGSEPQSSPYGFDPFLWSGVKNPLPAPTPMRNDIMAAGGFQGPAWYPSVQPAPPPTPPGPMSFVRQSLGLEPVGSTLQTRAPVPGFRFDGTMKGDEQETDPFLPADQMGALPPLPPMFPPRRSY